MLMLKNNIQKTICEMIKLEILQKFVNNFLFSAFWNACAYLSLNFKVNSHNICAVLKLTSPLMHRLSKEKLFKGNKIQKPTLKLL